ncbi:helix-turn-helix domain-containing protein [Neobacillus sp. CF12]|uniref:helix-turn-helix domain-containing protein n=1 Tax=Neobacillus sp. CF12 TaxID=3055864 RepID=UPI0025A06E4A|nr:helix-turn-helix domain-containing protein [Neobacillus sp. CF12]MDM5326781.1 helix-turn-helix domain-containing protein [Neobacillus sp. CF12]
MYVSAIPFYFALYQAFTLLSYIDKNKAFSEISVKALKKIKNYAAANLSILKNGKEKAIRFSTLLAICKALDCQPGDILEYRSDDL